MTDVLTLLLGLLAGNEFLADLSAGPQPLSRDPSVAAAWDLPALPEATGVSRTLAAATGCEHFLGETYAKKCSFSQRL